MTQKIKRSSLYVIQFLDWMCFDQDELEDDIEQMRRPDGLDDDLDDMLLGGKQPTKSRKWRVISKCQRISINAACFIPIIALVGLMITIFVIMTTMS